MQLARSLALVYSSASSGGEHNSCAGRPPTPRAMSRKCFSCLAADGRRVTLYKSRYDDHILREHPELARDFDFPAQQIEHALVNAERVAQGQGGAWVYVGPPVQANPPAGRQRIHVIVRPERSGRDWWVVTAYAELVLE